MPTEHDLDPPAMTDEERRAKRRFEAGFAFETQPGGRNLGRRGAHFQTGVEEARVEEARVEEDSDGE